MTSASFIERVRDNGFIKSGSEEQRFMDIAAREAQRTTAEINTGYHSQEELTELLSALTGREVDSSVRLFPPIYSDFGKNIRFGKGVFVNSGCCFQDQGGVSLGDGTFVGHQVVFATLNHSLSPADRGSMTASPITVGKNVWIGSHATILAGVTVGDNSVVAAGAVVTRSLPANVVAAGVPAKVVKYLAEDTPLTKG